jgi:hypothetical protein
MKNYGNCSDSEQLQIINKKKEQLGADPDRPFFFHNKHMFGNLALKY